MSSDPGGNISQFPPSLFNTGEVWKLKNETGANKVTSDIHEMVTNAPTFQLLSLPQIGYLLLPSMNCSLFGIDRNRMK